ncbi:MAG: hypothetical protein ACREMH_02950 [Gemmatimonadales bacterium]
MVLHAVLVAIIIAGAREFPILPGAAPVFIVPLPEGGERAVELPAYREPAAGFRLPLPGLPLEGAAGRDAAVRLRELSDAVARRLTDSFPFVPGIHGRGRPGRIAPALGDGRLWVRPLPAEPRELAQRLRRSTAELADSIIEVTVQAYLDSIAHEPGADGTELPRWVTEVEGKKYGIDGSSIYIAGLRIPAALLALLPLPAAGNPDQNADWARMMDIRRDIYYSAARAGNVAEFKRYVREIRERKEAERRFKENQRQRPDSQPPAPPSPKDAPLP